MSLLKVMPNRKIKLWSTEEKIQKCIVIKSKLRELGLITAYKEQMILLDNIIQQYVKHDQEHTGIIIFPDSNRFMDIKLRNNKKWNPVIVIKTNPSL